MNVIQQIEAEHAAKLPGAKIPQFQPGDTVVVNVKVAEGERTRVQAYEGVCIARSGHGLNENFTVRKISYGEGVERVFPVYSPMIDSVKVVPRGKADGCFINTSGVGLIERDLEMGAARVQAGDAVLVSGPIGDHGMAIMLARGEQPSAKSYARIDELIREAARRAKGKTTRPPAQ